MMDIKTSGGEVRFSAPVSEKAVYRKELMKEEYVFLPFSTKRLIAFRQGDYIETGYGRFEINDLNAARENRETGGYDYELRFDSPVSQWNKRILFYNRSGFKEKSWKLTGNASAFMKIVEDNLAEAGFRYKTGVESIPYQVTVLPDVPETPKALSFDSSSIYDALTTVAEAWETEWYVTGNIIYLGKCETGPEVEFDASVISETTRKSGDTDGCITRLYPFGSTRNISNRYRRNGVLSLHVAFSKTDTVNGRRMNIIQLNVPFEEEYVDNSDHEVVFFSVSGKHKGEEIRAFYLPYLPLGSQTEYYDIFMISADELNGVIFSPGDRLEIIKGVDLSKIPAEYRVDITESGVVEGVIEKRLMLPEGKDYIDLRENLREEEIVEGVVAFDEVYPRRTGTLSEVLTQGRTTAIDREDGTKGEERWVAYRYKDAGLTFAENYIIKGRELRIVFQTGALSGMDFSVQFNPDNLEKNDPGVQLFEIVRNENYGRMLPDEYLYPEKGDTYVLYGYDAWFVSDRLIPDAENELLQVATEYLKNQSLDTSVYDCRTNPVRCMGYTVNEESGQPEYNELEEIDLEVGRKVRLTDPVFFPDGRSSRIYGFEKKLDNPFEATYQVGETASYSRLQKIENSIKAITYKSPAVVGSNGGPAVYLIKKYDNTAPADSNAYSGLRALAEFFRKSNIVKSSALAETGKEEVYSTLRAQEEFISKKYSDSVAGQIFFQQGFISDQYSKFNDGLTSEGKAELNSGLTVQGGARIDQATVSGRLTAGELQSVHLQSTHGNVHLLQVPDTLTADKAYFGGKISSAGYAGGMSGWQIGADGAGDMKSLKLREFLEVPELRYNRISVITGEQWSAPGGGIVGSVDEENCVLNLKLEPGEAAAVEVDDICKGIFNNRTGFQTSFFRITEKMTDSSFRYALRDGCVYHPQKGMHFVAYGNFSRKDRQASAYNTTTYQRYLKGVDEWEIRKEMICMQFGDLSNLTLFGIDMTGYSAYLKNIYMTGHIKQISGDGTTEVPVMCFKGEWTAGKYWPYDSVTHTGSTWLCVSENSTTQEPVRGCTDWLNVVSKGEKGDRGVAGQRGPEGAVVRMRGEWIARPQTPYLSNGQWRDVVFYNGNHYIVKLGMTVPQGSGAPAVTPTYWEGFNEFENVSTRVLLAGQGRIDVLGAGELFVGETREDGGWQMTKGEILHTESKLKLDAKGHLYIPQGGFTIGNQGGEDYIRDQVPYVGKNLVRHSGGYLQESPWPEIRRVWNNQTLLYAVMPNTDLSCMYARQEGRVNFIQDNIPVRAGVIYTLSFRVCVYVAEGAVKYPPFHLTAFQRAGAGAPEEQIISDTSVRDHIAGDEYLHTYQIVPKYTGGLKLFFYVVVDGYDQTLPSGTQDRVALWMGNIKLEEGEKATAWNLAAEDLVSKGLVVSAINMLPDTIKIQADHIELNGEVIARGILNSDAGLNINGNFLIDNQGNFTANSGVINQGVTVGGVLDATRGSIGGFGIDRDAILANNDQGRLRLRLTRQDIPVLDQMLAQQISWIGGVGSDLSGSDSRRVVLSQSRLVMVQITLTSVNFTVSGLSRLECMLDYEMSLELNGPSGTPPTMVRVPHNDLRLTVDLINVSTGGTVRMLDRGYPAKDTRVPLSEELSDGTYRLQAILMNEAHYDEGTLAQELPSYMSVAGSLSLYMEDTSGGRHQGKVTRYSNYSVLGGNGLASVWDQNRYFYLSQDGDYLLQSRGVQRLLSPDSRSGVVVKDGGVKIVEGGKEYMPGMVICGGKVSVQGGISNKVGLQNFYVPSLQNGITRVQHDFGNNNYLVMLTVDGTVIGHQDNIVTLISKTANYFEVKGKNSTTAQDEVTPFYFTMIKSN